jgi:hypothetical protein
VSGNRAERRSGRSPARGSAQPTGSLGNRYGPTAQRRALAPVVLAVIALLVGVELLGSDAFLVIRYAVAILALITAVFVYQSKAWAWLPVPVVIAVLWNPVVPLPFSGKPWAAGQFVAAALLLAVGAFVKYREPDTRPR